jgi:hypothetical protein
MWDLDNTPLLRREPHSLKSCGGLVGIMSAYAVIPAWLGPRRPGRANQARPGSECTTTQIACTESPVLFRYSCGVEESKAIESPGPSS